MSTGLSSQLVICSLFIGIIISKKMTLVLHVIISRNTFCNDVLESKELET